ncbi:hypothetical protein B566_EDAN008663 [Ephemera danica]|nr:hypothetical protein B566_EDAN008663 [Ephemera danica]
MSLRSLTLILWCTMLVTAARDTQQLLSRHKRYITFPEGSAMTFLLCCNSVGPYAGDIMTFGLDVDMSWELPNDTRLFYSPHDARSDVRREKRETYLQLEDLFSAMPPSDNLLDDEDWMHRHYEQATRAGVLRHTRPRRGSDSDECRHLYPGCPISLLQVIMG